MVVPATEEGTGVSADTFVPGGAPATGVVSTMYIVEITMTFIYYFTYPLELWFDTMVEHWQ